MTAILRITDGTTTVNLLSGKQRSGFHLANWRPGVAQFKDDGVWQDPILADNRRLADYRWQNVVETFEVHLSGHYQDGLARELQTLQRLLVQAANYWKGDWQCAPVWIEARASCETNTRYALVHAGTIPEIDNPHAQSFFRRYSFMRDMTVIVERGHWLETAPGTGVAVERSNPGRSATTAAAEVFVANKHNTAALTHVYYYDASIGSYSTNIVAAVPDYKFLPDSPAVGDIVYFAAARPFCSLVFDIRTAMTGVTGIVWEYSQGGAVWATLDVQDNTNHDGAGDQVAFDTTGVKSVHWEQPADWAEDDVNVIFAWWVRARVTAAAGATAPIQQNRVIYTVLWPYIEVAADEAPGDLPPLTTVVTKNRSAYYDGAAVYDDGMSDAWLGLRSYSRGSNFTAFINIADEQNNASITVAITAIGGAAAAFADIYDAPSGRGVDIQGAAATDGASIEIAIASPLAEEYYGTYHAFLRVRNDDATDMSAYVIGYVANQELGRTSTASIDNWNFAVQLVDLGRIDLSPSAMLAASLGNDMRLYAQIYCNDHMYVYDLILIPVDEWAAHIYANEYDRVFAIAQLSPDYNSGTSIDIDSIGIPKRPNNVKIMAGTSLRAIGRNEANGPSILQANTMQRLWILQGQRVSILYAMPHMTATIDIERQARYLALRGGR